MKNILKLIIFIIIVMPNFILAAEICNSCIYQFKVCNKETNFIVNTKVSLGANNVVQYTPDYTVYAENKCGVGHIVITLVVSPHFFAQGCPDLYYAVAENKVYEPQKLYSTYGVEEATRLFENGELFTMIGQSRMAATCKSTGDKLKADANAEAEINSIDRECTYKKDNSSITIKIKNGTVTSNVDSYMKGLTAADFKNGCPRYLSEKVGSGLVAQITYSVHNSYSNGAYSYVDPSQANATTPPNSGTSSSESSGEPIANCGNLLGDPETDNSPASYLQTAFDIIKYIAIVAFLVLSAGDVAKTVLSENKEMSKEITRKILLRLIYVICIFFIPDILKAILTATKIYGDCGIS